MYYSIFVFDPINLRNFLAISNAVSKLLLSVASIVIFAPFSMRRHTIANLPKGSLISFTELVLFFRYYWLPFQVASYNGVRLYTFCKFTFAPLWIRYSAISRRSTLGSNSCYCIYLLSFTWNYPLKRPSVMLRTVSDRPYSWHFVYWPIFEQLSYYLNDSLNYF